MTVRQELRERAQWAGRAEQLNLLPPDPSFFQRRLAKLVSWRLREELDPSQIGSKAACKETFDRLLPLVDFLTQPRSIDEFQDLKRELMDIVWKYDYDLRTARDDLPKIDEDTRMSEIMSWLYWILPEVKIFPYSERDNLFYTQGGPEKIWELFEKADPSSSRTSKEKIVSLQEAVRLIEECHQRNEDSRVGYVVGKWRLGPTSGHIDLFEEAKQVLGWGGLLIVGVEGKKSIKQRCGEKSIVLPDAERLRRIAALETVDYAVLHNPSEEELKDLRNFYYQIKQALSPDFLFIGSADYYLRPLFEKEARELGAILLWQKQEIQVSTSDLVSNLTKRIREAS